MADDSYAMWRNASAETETPQTGSPKVAYRTAVAYGFHLLPCVRHLEAEGAVIVDTSADGGKECVAMLRAMGILDG